VWSQSKKKKTIPPVERIGGSAKRKCPGIMHLRKKKNGGKRAKRFGGGTDVAVQREEDDHPQGRATNLNGKGFRKNFTFGPLRLPNEL